MQEVTDQKLKLQQKKNRLAAEETRLRIKERKMRTRHLIEIGGLIVKAKIDHLPINALYGALLSLKDTLDSNENILSSWKTQGHDAFNAESKTSTALILKFDDKPTDNIRESIRSHGLRYNKFREEWYGNITNLEELKNSLTNIKHEIEIIDNLNE